MIVFDVAHASQFATSDAFGFLVKRGVEVGAIEGIADRDEVGRAFFIYGGETARPLAVYKVSFRLCKG